MYDNPIGCAAKQRSWRLGLLDFRGASVEVWRCGGVCCACRFARRTTSEPPLIRIGEDGSNWYRCLAGLRCSFIASIVGVDIRLQRILLASKANTSLFEDMLLIDNPSSHGTKPPSLADQCKTTGTANSTFLLCLPCRTAWAIRQRLTRYFFRVRPFA